VTRVLFVCVQNAGRDEIERHVFHLLDALD
jgi:hypothetical protein